MPKKTKNGGTPKQAMRGGVHGGVQGVDLAEIERLLEFMKKHRLELFEYENSGLRIMLKKESMGSASAPRAATTPAIGPLYETSAPAQPAPVAPPAAADSTPPAAHADEDIHVVKSPIVGTFYSAPSPGADSFVKIGSRVDAGQTLCIIEAMKLMNEIEADVAGEIAKVFVENGQPVEYGEKLFGIRTNGKK
jgi:acetyl-CoA carboxylase biotin carboxyl carrier protein